MHSVSGQHVAASLTCSGYDSFHACKFDASRLLVKCWWNIRIVWVVKYQAMSACCCKSDLFRAMTVFMSVGLMPQGCLLSAGGISG